MRGRKIGKRCRCHRRPVRAPQRQNSAHSDTTRDDTTLLRHHLLRHGLDRPGRYPLDPPGCTTDVQTRGPGLERAPPSTNREAQGTEPTTPQLTALTEPTVTMNPSVQPNFGPRPSDLR